MRSSSKARRVRPAARVLFFLLATMVFASRASAQDSSDGLRAAPQSTETPDEQILKGLERAKIDREGLVIVGAEWPGCTGVEMGLTRRIDGKLQRVLVRGMHKFFGTLVNFQPKGLGAGEWYITWVKCPAAKMVFNGVHAKFEVQPGEIVDVGALKIDYTPGEFLPHMLTGAATIRLSVQPSSELRMAHLKKVIPRVMAAIKRRPMVLVGASEQKVRRQGLFER
jgi:hypothetical protein